MHSPGHVAATDERSPLAAVPALEAHARQDRRRARLGAHLAAPSSSTAAPAGALYVGSPETVARKIADTAQALGLTRFDLKYSAGTLPHALKMQTIELYGSEVIPRVRELLAAAPAPA